MRAQGVVQNMIGVAERGSPFRVHGGTLTRDVFRNSDERYLSRGEGHHSHRDMQTMSHPTRWACDAHQNGLITTSATAASIPSTGNSLNIRYHLCVRRFCPRSKVRSNTPQYAW